MPFVAATLRDALIVLGDVLADRGQSFDVVVVGGGALLLRGQIARSTNDLDVVARVEASGGWTRAAPLPPAFTAAVADVGRALDLADDWINVGPEALFVFGLPAGFADRVVVERFGALTVRLASRVDQIALKLFAAADHWPRRDKHLQDLIALTPTTWELLNAARWSMDNDASPGFRDQQLVPVLQSFDIELPDV